MSFWSIYIMYILEYVFYISLFKIYDYVVLILIVSLSVSEIGYGFLMKCLFMILIKLIVIIRYESSDENDW